jgi:hypothetical protein
MTTTAPAARLAARTPSVDARRPSSARLVGVELRKTVDTRAGRWLLAVLGGLAVAALGYRLWNAGNTPVGYEHWFGTALTGVQMLLPVLGVLAMTSEWTQRTALSTFTLVPQRGRVLAVKLVAALVLAVAVVLAVAALSAVATLVGGALTGDVVAWGDVPRLVGGAVVATGLSVLMGAGFGALLQHTTAAIVAFFLAPMLWGAVAVPLFGDHVARWLDVFSAFAAVAAFDVAGVVAQTLVAVGAWVVLPLALGVVRSLRREVS